ncbi:hypothetical protein D3C87_1272710 [compost metagenome]
MSLSVEERAHAVHRVLEHRGSEELDDMLRSSNEAAQVIGLMGSVASNGMKNAILAGTGDTHMSMTYDEACKVATRIGFELVHTFEFWPVDDQGIEITNDERRKEHMTVWAHREYGMALTIESYTGIDDKEGYHNVGANSLHLFFAWTGSRDGWSPSGSGSWDYSKSNPNWRAEYRKAQQDGDIYKLPDDLAFVGHMDVRDGLINQIEMMKLHGKFVTPRPTMKSGAFGDIYGVGFYTDYRRAEFLGPDGKYDFTARDGLKELHAARVAQLPEWFRTMMGVA